MDLTNEIIAVRDMKFFKTRLVPIGPKLNRELGAHIERRRLLPFPRGEESTLFTTRDVGRGTMCGSSLGSSMSVEPPEFVAPSASVGLHRCTIFATRPPCTG
ncbi:hypothetical protein [Mesorhizobium sp. M0859]|uniref:hypothetical protein n=1 Tax=Mesorhizobium sp. M0859 TaxID=2957014 RepID=UPI0033362372